MSIIVSCIVCNEYMNMFQLVDSALPVFYDEFMHELHAQVPAELLADTATSTVVQPLCVDTTNNTQQQQQQSTTAALVSAYYMLLLLYVFIINNYYNYNVCRQVLHHLHLQ